MSGNDTWTHPLFSGLCHNGFNLCYGCLCGQCAVASAKSNFDGSDWCFNCVCFSMCPMLVRNYIRQGYGINGRVGASDCCMTSMCGACVVVQMLNEVQTRGAKLVSVPVLEQSPWIAPIKDYSCLGDPCDFCMTCFHGGMENASVYSQMAGTPIWFPYFSMLNICQIHHLIRKSYGIGGNDCCDDCVKPTLCMLIPFYNSIFYYKTIAMLRAEIAHRGRPSNYSVDSNVMASIVIGEVGNPHAMTGKVVSVTPPNKY